MSQPKMSDKDRSLLIMTVYFPQPGQIPLTPPVSIPDHVLRNIIAFIKCN